MCCLCIFYVYIRKKPKKKSTKCSGDLFGGGYIRDWYFHKHVGGQ